MSPRRTEQTPQTAGYRQCNAFQATPNWLSECDSKRAQSAHPGGLPVALADGSVRSVAAGIAESVWAAVCHPADGQTVGADW